MSELYEVGTRAWQPDTNEGWVPSEVEQKLVEGDKVRLIFRLENGEVRCHSLMLICIDSIITRCAVECRITRCSTCIHPSMPPALPPDRDYHILASSPATSARLV